jgi:hypothetical protein
MSSSNKECIIHTSVMRPQDNSPKVRDFGQRCVFPDGLAQRQAIGNIGMHPPIKLLRCLPATKNASSTLRSGDRKIVVLKSDTLDNDASFLKVWLKGRLSVTLESTHPSDYSDDFQPQRMHHPHFGQET